MMPDALGAPVAVEIDDSSACVGATSHPTGAAALAVESSRANGVIWVPYTASGSAAGPEMSPVAGGPGSDVDLSFHPVTDGFRGVTFLSPNPPAIDFRLRTWDVAGRLVTDLPLLVRTIAPLPDGGSIAVVASPGWGGNASLAWVDPGGHVTRTVALDADASRAIVNWTTGHVFAFVGGTSARPTQGRWYDASGSPLTPWFRIPVTKGGGYYQRLLADGVVALGTLGGNWLLAVRDGVEGTEELPAWLAARPGTRLVTIRGGRGYAVLPSTGADAFEVVTAGGESCGTVTVPQPNFDGSAAPWSPPRIDVGWDGTIFQTFMTQAPGSPSAQRCVFRWWPAMLR